MKETERDVESAYGSDSLSDSNLTFKKGTFSIQESSSVKEKWHQSVIKHVRNYMVLEGLFLFFLLLLLINSYRISSENQQTQEMISNLQLHFEEFQKQHGSRCDTNMKGEDSMIKESKIIEETVSKVLEEVKEKVEPFVQPVVVQEPVIPMTTKNTQKVEQHEKVPTNGTYTLNAASLIEGATIDTGYSSSSNLNPLFGRDQSALVLMDRHNPPLDRMWCSEEKEPVLTINLAKYIKPTAISYQHANFNGTIQNGTVQTMDVLTCIDYYCEKTEALLLNLKYRTSGYKNTEQVYQIPSTSNISSVGRVQFRFRENYGNVQKTCVSLVRVYGETNDIPKIKERSLKDAEKCSDLKYYYHNSYVKYHLFNYKSCDVLYSTGCCSECPECCEECLVQDVNPTWVFFGVLLLVFPPFWPLWVAPLLLIGLAFYGIFLLLKKLFECIFC